MNRVMSPAGLNYIIPYVQSFKNSNNGTSQNINIQIDAGSGKSLVRTYHAIYNSQEDLDTAYDHANTPTISGVFFFYTLRPSLLVKDTIKSLSRKGDTASNL